MKTIPTSPWAVNKQQPTTTTAETDNNKNNAHVHHAPTRDYYVFTSNTAHPKTQKTRNMMMDVQSPSMAHPPCADFLASPWSFDTQEFLLRTPTTRPSPHAMSMGNRRRAHTEEPHRTSPLVSQLPMAPSLDDLAVTTPNLHDTYDHVSAVSSISNTSWERYEKLQQRYGWAPPPPPTQPEPPFVPPTMIYFSRQHVPKKQSQDIPQGKVPDWFGDAPPQPKRLPRYEERRQHRRAQTMPSPAAVAVSELPSPPAVWNGEEPEQPPPPAAAAAAADDPLQEPPPEHWHPLLRTSVPENGMLRGKDMLPPALEDETPVRRRRSRHARISSEHNPTTTSGDLLLTPTSPPTRGASHIRGESDQLGAIIRAMEQDLQPTDLQVMMTPALDTTSNTSGTSSSHDNHDHRKISRNSNTNNGDTDTNKTHFHMPAFLWNKCVKSPVVQKIKPAMRHRRAKSYDFKASSSACFS